MLYETSGEAQTRLCHTFFLYKENPVYCNGVVTDMNDDKTILLNLTFFPSGKETALIKLTDPDLKYRGLRLGYVNLPSGATYVTRYPTRKYKQGLNGDNIKCTEPAEGKAPKPKFQDFCKSVAFQDTLLGRYPTIAQAAERLRAQGDQKPASVAFHRWFALIPDNLRGDFMLEYRGRVVGFGDLKYEFTCASEYSYLEDIIKQSGIKVRQ